MQHIGPLASTMSTNAEAPTTTLDLQQASISCANHLIISFFADSHTSDWSGRYRLQNKEEVHLGGTIHRRWTEYSTQSGISLDFPDRIPPSKVSSTKMEYSRCNDT